MEQILSIDIGVRNLALWIEEFDSTKVEEYKKKLQIIKKPDRVNMNNESTDIYKGYLNDFMVNASTTIYADKIDLCESVNISYTKNRMIILTNEILFNIIKEFDQRKELLKNVKYIVIEKQLKTNPNAQAIQNHIHAYFLHQYGLSKTVEIFDSCYKTRLLGCPRKVKNAKDTKSDKLIKITKTFRKRWTTNLTRDILMLRKDKKFFDFIFNQNKSKADDLSDTFCQVYAFVLLKFY